MKTNAKRLRKDLAYNKGFEDGWHAAAKRMKEVLGDLPDKSKIGLVVKVSGGNPFRKGTGQAKVYEYIRENPGQRNKEISSGAGVSYKIVSNALHRLKGVIIDDCGWKLA